VDTSIDSKKEAVANTMESAASKLREKAENLPGGEKVSRAAQTTAEAVETAADYVREQDLSDMLADVREAVARHPAAALLAATALGFVIARSLRD
jgi:hypothetical protein